MRTNATRFVLAGMLVATVVIAQQRKQQEIDLQAAIRTETVKGNLKEAIKQYQTILAKYGNERAVSAQALLHMAECYQKLGDEQSRNLYEKLVRDYADQKDAAAKARADLAGVGSATMRRLTHRSETPDISFSQVTPDGQWLGGTDWFNGDLVMVHLATGEIRRLVTAAALDSTRWGETPLVSPDRRQVAFWWWDYKDVTGDYDGELRLMTNESGAKPRALRKNARPVAWAPDGKSILVTLNPDRQNRIDLAWVSATDGSTHIIKTIEPWRKLARVSLSPDGLYIAYAAPAPGGTQETNIYILSKDGTTQAELIKGDSNEEPVWAPDGTHLLFSSNRSGTFGLWSVPVRDGRRSGLPSLVKAETGKVKAFGISSAGTYYYGRSVRLDQVFIVAMDHARGKARGPATEGFVGDVPAWSRDGKWLAYRRARPEGQGDDLIVHSIESGADRTISHQMGGGLHWLLDGSLEYGALGSGTKRVTVNNSEPKEITHLIGLPVGITEPVGVLSTDDKLLYRPANRDTQNRANPREGFEIIDAETGQRKQMFTVSAGVFLGTARLSPDGRTLLYCAPGKDARTARIMRVGVDGTGEKEILAPVPRNLQSLAWTSDGQGVLFGQVDEKGLARIMRIPAQGGQPEFTGISTEGLRTIAVSHDGSRIAYSVNSTNDEVWALDNVLAGLR